MFAEISPELAAELRHPERRLMISVVSLRGGIEVRAMVSRRIRPMQVERKDRAPGLDAVSFRRGRAVSGRRGQ